MSSQTASTLRPDKTDNTAITAGLNEVLAQYAAGHVDSAMGLCAALLAKAPKHATTLSTYGGLLITQGRTEDALTSLHAAIDADPECADAHNNLRIAYEQSGRLSECIDYFTRFIAAHPRSASAHHHLGLAWSSMGAHEQAAQALAVAGEIAHDNASIWHPLGNAYGALKRDEQAIDAFNRALTLRTHY